MFTHQIFVATNTLHILNCMIIQRTRDLTTNLINPGWIFGATLCFPQYQRSLMGNEITETNYGDWQV